MEFFFFIKFLYIEMCYYVESFLSDTVSTTLQHYNLE